MVKLDRGAFVKENTLGERIDSVPWKLLKIGLNVLRYPVGLEVAGER
jgi:hypothetical protein